MDEKKKPMLKCLKLTRGRVAEAADKANISTSTHYAWMEIDEEYKQAVADIKEGNIDYGEGQLFKLMEGAEYQTIVDGSPVTLKDKPSPAAVIFFLKTQGKKRGYIERTEITGEDGGPIKIVAPDNI